MRPLSLFLLVVAPAAAAPFGFPETQAFLARHCRACHTGSSAVGGFDISKFPDAASIVSHSQVWTRAMHRVREGEMPPKGSPAPTLAAKESFAAYITDTLHTAACSDGIDAPPFAVRRLNRAEYTATVRDLLNIHINAGRDLPADGAGGEGFDNAAETLFLSPIHAEKYMEAAGIALEYALKDPPARKVFLNFGADPRKTLEAFLPRAFRRPARPGEVDRYLALYTAARQRGDSFEEGISQALRAVLVSPHFLFRLPLPGDYALASRLSYFLWGSMPDAELLELAAAGRLRQPGTLRAQALRLLADAKSREFAENFTEQWLSTRELGRDIKPDPQLSPEYYDEEIQSAMRYEPMLFVHELLVRNLPLTNLIDSDFSVLTNKLAKFYGVPAVGLRQQPRVVPLPPDSPRGGLLGMSAVLAVTSYPQRTSPVLRGKWILDALLGTPPPPPPPNVPELKEHAGAKPQTMRERLSQHRANPVCATCHDRIDPLGFGLENYDSLGRWRATDAGLPVDASGVLADGTRFDGARQMKTALMQRKDQILRNFASKMLGFALGRSLTLEDQCALDLITARLADDQYRGHTLIQEIVLSEPFLAK